MRKEYVVGSRAFFGGIEGFVPGDRDTLILVDYPENECGIAFGIRSEMRLKGNCYLFYRRKPKEQMFSDCVDPIEVGKFLVPEVAKDLGLSIDDIKTLEPLVSQLEGKHLYEADIYNAYLSNEDFILTEEQKIRAYETYQKYR